MSTVKVSDINVISVHVTDLERSKKFYSEHLGFEPDGEMPPGFLMKSGNVSLYLEASRQLERESGSSISGVSPCFAIASVKQGYESLAATGVSIITPYQEFGPDFAFFQIEDPDGNIIEIAGKP